MYLLDRHGAETLQTERGIDVKWRTSDKSVSTDFLDHTLAIADVWCAIHLACQSQGYDLSWIGERALKADYDYVTLTTASGRRRKVSVIPDSFFVITTQTMKYSFFLELDRGTMALDRFKTKIKGYIEYYRSGGVENRFGSRRVRVLTVNPNRTNQRILNLKDLAEKEKAPDWFWFAHSPDIGADAVLYQPVWLAAGDDNRQSLLPA